MSRALLGIPATRVGRPATPRLPSSVILWSVAACFVVTSCYVVCLHMFVALGGGEGPWGCPCGGEMGSPSPPQAPIFWDVFFFRAIFTCFHGNSAYLRPCYHALRHPFGAADRAMLLN